MNRKILNLIESNRYIIEKFTRCKIEYSLDKPPKELPLTLCRAFGLWFGWFDIDGRDYIIYFLGE